MISVIHYILVLTGLVAYGTELLTASLLSYYIIWVVLAPCWWHLGLWHWGSISTHKLVHHFHMITYCMFYPFPPSGPLKIHKRHHDLVNTLSDRNTFKVNQGRIKHLFNFTVPPLRVRPSKNPPRIPDLPFWNWCEENHLKIYLSFQLIAFLLFPKWFIFLYVIPSIIAKMDLPVKLHDIIFHFNPFENFKNKSWAFPILFCDAWHVDHHRSPMVINFGPGIFKWINPQWWYMCLVDESVRKETLNFKNHTIERDV